MKARASSSETAQEPCRRARSFRGFLDRYGYYRVPPDEDGVSYWISRPIIVPGAIRDLLWVKEKGITPAESARVYRRAEKLQLLLTELGWSDHKIKRLGTLVRRYEEARTIENYLNLRARFPDVEIYVGPFSLYSCSEEVARYFASRGIEEQLLRAAFARPNELALDFLCLRILERIAARDKVPRVGIRCYNRRKRLISDSDVDFIIALILDLQQRWSPTWKRIPSSFLALIRYRLIGVKPDLEVAFVNNSAKCGTAVLVSQVLKKGEALSINKLKKIANISRSRAERLLKDPEFMNVVTEFKGGWLRSIRFPPYLGFANPSS